LSVKIFDFQHPFASLAPLYNAVGSLGCGSQQAGKHCDEGLSACGAGEHVIEVLYLNKPIAGSPFHCQVFDWAKINVSKLPHATVTDRLVDFDSKQPSPFISTYLL